MIEQGLTNARELEQGKYWHTRAQAGYKQLGWVNASEPLQKMVELAALKGDEIVVDAGTGSHAILKALAPHLIKGGRVYGFDVSAEMMDPMIRSQYPNAHLFQGDVYALPLRDNSVDLMTARMVYHNLSDVALALREAKRVLRPGGRLIVCEYVTPENQAAWQHERNVFDIKERGRNLWTGSQLETLIKSVWDREYHNGHVRAEFATLAQYSVRDWMSKSGLPSETQQNIVDLYLNAPEAVSGPMRITYTEDNDALVDRPFTFVVATR